MIRQTWPGVQPHSRAAFLPGASLITKCRAAPSREKQNVKAHGVESASKEEDRS